MWQSIMASSIVLIILIFLIAGLYALVNMKKVSARKEHFRQMHKDLKTGQNVIFLNGLYGSLTRVGNETVDIKVKSGAIMEVSRYAITEIVK